LAPDAAHGLGLHVADLGLDQGIRHVDRVREQQLVHDRGLVLIAQRLLEFAAHVVGDVLAQFFDRPPSLTPNVLQNSSSRSGSRGFLDVRTWILNFASLPASSVAR
jgi:hypothetical protein